MMASSGWNWLLPPHPSLLRVYSGCCYHYAAVTPGIYSALVNNRNAFAQGLDRADEMGAAAAGDARAGVAGVAGATGNPGAGPESGGEVGDVDVFASLGLEVVRIVQALVPDVFVTLVPAQLFSAAAYDFAYAWLKNSTIAGEISV